MSASYLNSPPLLTVSKASMATFFPRPSNPTATSVCCMKRDTSSEPKSVLDLLTISPASSPGTSPNRLIDVGMGSAASASLQKSASIQKTLETAHNSMQQRIDASPTLIDGGRGGKADHVLEVMGGLDLDLDFIMKTQSTQSGLNDVFATNSPSLTADQNLWDHQDETVLIHVLSPAEERFVDSDDLLLGSASMYSCAETFHEFGDNRTLSLINDSLETSPLIQESTPLLHFGTSRKRPYSEFYDEEEQLLPSAQFLGQKEETFPDLLSPSTHPLPAGSVTANPYGCETSKRRLLEEQPINRAFHINISQAMIGNTAASAILNYSALQACSTESASPTINESTDPSIMDVQSFETNITTCVVEEIPSPGIADVDEQAAFPLDMQQHQEEQGLQLVHLLLRCAEMVGEKQYGVAQPLLSRLQHMSSPDGDPMERIAYYFSETLLKGVHAPNFCSSKPAQDYFSMGLMRTHYDDDELNGSCDGSVSQVEIDRSYLALYQALPYTKCMHFTANQAILEAMADSSQLHVVDFDIQQGIQWPNFLQSLAVRPGGPPQSIKISAVGSCLGRLRQTGRMLADFASALKLKFCFNPVVVNSFRDLHVGMFNVNQMVDQDQAGYSPAALSDQEAIAVNFPAILHSRLWEGMGVEQFLGFVRRLQPRVLTVIKAERHNDSPSFVHRFIEVLFYYSALFDSLEVALDRSSPDRARIERVLLSSGLKNIIVSASSCVDSLEEMAMHAGTDKWHCLLSKAGFHITPLSEHALYQAKLLLRLYASEAFKLGDHHDHGSSDSRALTIGWKETPLFAIMAAMSCGDNIYKDDSPGNM